MAEEFNAQIIKPTREKVRGAKNRDEQIEIAKRCLAFFWEEKHQNTPDSEFKFSRSHARSCFVANMMRKLVRPEDNSIVGFPRRFRNFASEGDKQKYQQSLLDEYFFLLPTPLPPQFIGLSNYKGDQPFVAIFYQGTKATMADGRTQITFPFYEAYEPLVRHVAVEYYILRKKAFLGADDGEATHALVLDTVENKIYLGCYESAHFFLGTQQPVTKEEIAEAERAAEELIKRFENANSLEALQEFGMFSLFAPVNSRRGEVEAMAQFLDDNTPEEITDFLRQFSAKK